MLGDESYKAVEFPAIERDIARLLKGRVVPLLRKVDATRHLLRPLRSRGLTWVIQLDVETTRHHIDDRETYWVRAEHTELGHILEFTLDRVIYQGEWRFGHAVMFELIVGKHNIQGSMNLVFDDEIGAPDVQLWSVTNIMPPDKDG